MIKKDIIYLMRRGKPLEKVCEDEEFSYYSIMVYGFSLMYRQYKYRHDGRRQYKYTEELVRLFGFPTMNDFILHDTHKRRRLQLWREYVSPEALDKHFSEHYNVSARLGNDEDFN